MKDRLANSYKMIAAMLNYSFVFFFNLENINYLDLQ